MNEACLIANETVNEKVARMNAAMTVLAILLFVFTPAKWIIFILGVDFLLRGFAKSSYSPLSTMNKWLLTFLKVEPAMVNAGPKKFAAKIGFFFCLAIAVCHLIGLSSAANIIGLTMLLFAFLEASFGYCVGCKMYSLFLKANFIKLR